MAIRDVTLIDETIVTYSEASDLLKVPIKKAVDDKRAESGCRSQFMQKLARLKTLMTKLHARIDEFPDPDRVDLWRNRSRVDRDDLTGAG